MICNRCLLRSATRIRTQCLRSPSSSAARAFTTGPALSAKPTDPGTATASTPDKGAPGASSSPSDASPPGVDGKTGKDPIVRSSVPAGTPLRGLNFFKNKGDPIAMEDHEYPTWLWEVLAEKKKKSKEDENQGDLFSKSKKQRRIAAKKLRKQALLNPDGIAPKIPLHEQTIDLPAGDGSVEGAKDAGQARAALTKSMRVKRRAAIKEDNFLRAMR